MNFLSFVGYSKLSDIDLLLVNEADINNLIVHTIFMSY